jgi:hypothetical protein
MSQIFPKWTNKIPELILLIFVVFFCGVIFIVWYWFSPLNTDVGYEPKQPIPFSHKLHNGTLEIDCMYCHTNVDKSVNAGIPPTQVCMNCHKYIKKDSFRLRKLIKSDKSGMPIKWIRIHKIPDYVRFDHQAHILKGVSCKACHGEINKMTRVHQSKPLSMSWCLDCHKKPRGIVSQESVTDLRNADKLSLEFMKIHSNKIKSLKAPVTNCTGCHQ